MVDNPHKNKKVWDLTDHMINHEIPEDELRGIIVDTLQKYEFHTSFLREVVSALRKELDYMRG